MAPSTNAIKCVLRLPAVMARTGLARSTIYEKISRNEFPRHVKLGARASGWIAAEVEDWLERRIAESRPAEVGA